MFALPEKEGSLSKIISLFPFVESTTNLGKVPEDWNTDVPYFPN